MLRADLRRVILAAGKTNRQFAAQPERGVVPPAEPDRHKGSAANCGNCPATSRAATTSAVISSLSITAIMPSEAHPGHPDFGLTAVPSLPLRLDLDGRNPQMAQKHWQ
jgi:hypothetical protein